MNIFHHTNRRNMYLVSKANEIISSIKKTVTKDIKEETTKMTLNGITKQSGFK